MDAFVTDASDDEYYFFGYSINDDINNAVAVPEMGSYIDNTPVLETRPEATQEINPEDWLRPVGRHFDAQDQQQNNQDLDPEPAPENNPDEDTDTGGEEPNLKKLRHRPVV